VKTAKTPLPSLHNARVKIEEMTLQIFLRDMVFSLWRPRTLRLFD